MMDKAVTDTHCLLGSRLRDPDSGRQGCIVGIDQSRETPALLVNWSESGVERVPLTAADLSGLVEASLAHDRRARGDNAVASPAHPDSRSSDDASSRARSSAARRSEQPAHARAPARSTGRPVDDVATAPGRSGDVDDYRPLATGSDGRR
ncbi:hypothetical protein [Halomonas sp. YLGW01]|uniref:hypothetical protein n=1 Tax=Halomonas sp. YLGW01 TaxID=2773308 RepID=UPI00177D721D|nr:hypothetical protein [Halomonas sp. YLGW01]